MLELDEGYQRLAVAESGSHIYKAADWRYPPFSMVLNRVHHCFLTYAVPDPDLAIPVSDFPATFAVCLFGD